MKDNYPVFIKYPKIPHLASCLGVLDSSVQVFEKLDGGNVQVRMHQGRILAGNRSKFLKDRDNKFDWFNDFLKWATGNYSFYNLPENFIVFGEWLAPHTLEYSPENRNKFYFIDFFNVDEARFLPYSQGKNILKKLNVEGLRFLSPITFKSGTLEKLEDLTEKSMYRDGKMEGVIVKDYGSQSFAKLWTSSIKRNSSLVFSDLQRVYFSMVESGATVSKLDVTRELHKDLNESGLQIPLDNVQEYVSQNYVALNSRHL